MLRKAAEFYLLAIIIAFVTTLWVGSSGAHHSEIFLYALLSWPASALILLAASKVGRIRAVATAESRKSA